MFKVFLHIFKNLSWPDPYSLITDQDVTPFPAPLDPALKGGACGEHSGQDSTSPMFFLSQHPIITRFFWNDNNACDYMQLCVKIKRYGL